jgi:hypothetical protein
VRGVTKEAYIERITEAHTRRRDALKEAIDHLQAVYAGDMTDDECEQSLLIAIMALNEVKYQSERLGILTRLAEGK